MVKYLQYLLNDIEVAKSQAPTIPEDLPFAGFDDEDESSFGSLTLTKLDVLLGIQAAAFPPEGLLNNEQVADLLTRTKGLWKSWHLIWDMPMRLNERQEYAAMLHAMHHEQVAWNYQSGGEVKICQFANGGYCPFGKEGGYCHCKELDNSVKHDIAIWEEHVRSQGLDPYVELSQEEEDIFEEEIRNRNFRKLFGDGWDQRTYFNLYPEVEIGGEEELAWDITKASDDDSWLDDFLFKDDQNPASEEGHDKGFGPDDLWDINDFDPTS